MRRLVLFDIDGTLLTSSGAAARSFREALIRVFGTSGPASGYSFAGRTDPQIARDLLRLAGVDPARIDAGLPAVWPLYLRLLAEEFAKTSAIAYPGVFALLGRLEEVKETALVGLLTGNVAEGARLKLESAGVGAGRFRVGAFGSDHADRKELPAIAIDRAAAVSGHRFEGKSVVIVGDTPYDIGCGAHIGVRTLAVATGSYTRSELAEHRPDHLFDDLTDLDAVWAAIFD
jgi:phosphoglycolate phosphatase-like HAD superfamily hydrolase